MSAEDDLQQRYFAAAAALERGELERARREFELLLLDHPKFAPAWDGLAGCHEAEGDLERAGGCYQKAMRLDRHGWRSRYNWGAALHRAGELEEACRWLREAAQRAPNERLIRYRLGQCQLDEGSFSLAAETFRRALELEERLVTDVELYLALGNAEVERGEYAAAEKAYERACLIAPNDARVFHRWAQLAARTGDSDGAERLISRAVALDSRSLLYRLFRLNLAMDRGDSHAAQLQIEQLNELPETTRLILSLRAELAYRQGDGVGARHLALEALATPGAPSDQAVDRALATLRELRGEWGTCRGYRLLFEVECGCQYYFRPYVVLAEDEFQAREFAADLQCALDPSPWRVAEVEIFPNDGGECMLGVYQVLLTRVLFDRELSAPGQSAA